MELMRHLKPGYSVPAALKQVSTKRFISILMVLLNSPNAFAFLNM